MYRMVWMSLFLILAGLAPGAAGAQQRNRQRQPAERAQLEQRLRQQLARVVRDRLGLNDQQMQRLSEVNQKYDAERRDLVRREFEVRRGLRQRLIDTSTAVDESAVGQLLTEQLRIQRARVDLLEAEQTDLAQFLTPSQRAKYLAIQEQMRRQMDQMRGRRNALDDRGGPPPRGGLRPPPP
jgi:hypothetical protein